MITAREYGGWLLFALAVALVTAGIYCLSVWQSKPAKKNSVQAKWMDKTADPGKDFNRYANGQWIDDTQIPADAGRWGAFNILRENTEKTLREILEGLAARNDLKPGSIEQKVGDFYFSAMNEAQIQAQGAKPLQSILDGVDAIGTTTDLQSQVARLHLLGIPVLFGFGGDADFKNSEQVIATAGQSGLGLPDRDYYLNTDAASVALRDKYKSLIARMFELLGETNADAVQHAETVLRIETELARGSMPKVEQREPENIYHITDLEDFTKSLTHFNFDVYLKSIGAPAFSKLNVMQPKFFTTLNEVLGKTSTADLKTYLRWHIVTGTASCLSSDFVNAQFEFYGKTMQGVPAQTDRWKRMVSQTNAALGEAVGQLYVAKAFPPEAKAKALELVDRIKDELRETITHLTWMSESTRNNALAKLNAFEAKFGYPDTWKDYTLLQIDRNSFAENVLRAREFASRKDIAKIGQKVDRSEWSMTPQTVNAYYSPTTNQIVFPAAILQAPFFDLNADDAVNLGGMGVVIGHEMTHGFDDEGSQFDGKGNVSDWWTETDKANFKSRIQLIRDQFSGFTVSGGLHVNGEFVSGEAAADLGGVKLAYKALQKMLKDKPRTKDANGFTDEQRFFIAFAQIWAAKARPETEQMLVKTDPHPPACYRVNGTLGHLPEFAKAFGLPETCPMMLPPNKRCQLW